MEDLKKDLLINEIIAEYEAAYQEIVAGTLRAIHVQKDEMKQTFSKQNGNWGLTTGKLRKDGTWGDTTTTYRLRKLAALGLFCSDDFQNYTGDLHKDIGYNHYDAKYIMVYLYNRVVKRQQGSIDEAPDYDDYSMEESSTTTEGAKSSTFTPAPFKCNYAKEDERKRELGTEGEKWVCEEEKKRLRKAGRDDLAQKVKHVAEEQGDGLGYDVLSYEEDGADRYIEVKTTTAVKKSYPFYVTRNELNFCLRNEQHYYLYRLYKFDKANNTAEVEVIEGYKIKGLCNNPTGYEIQLKD